MKNIEIFETDINNNFVELIARANGDNFIDICKILKVKYRISNRMLSLASKIKYPVFISLMVNGDCCRESTIIGATNINNYYFVSKWDMFDRTTGRIIL